MSENMSFKSFEPEPTEAFKTHADKYLTAASSVLDIGTGDGHNALYLGVGGHLVRSVDSSAAVIVEAESTKSFAVLSRPELRDSVLFETGDIRDDILGDELFDAVFLHCVLQDLDDREQFNQVITRAQDATVPGGLNLVRAIVGTHPDQGEVHGMKLYDAGEVEAAYVSKGWEIEEPTPAPLHDLVEINGQMQSVSYENTVARKPNNA